MIDVSKDRVVPNGGRFYTGFFVEFAQCGLLACFLTVEMAFW